MLYNNVYIIDLIDGVWQFIRAIKPEYKHIDTLYQLYTNKIDTEFNFNYEQDYNQFVKQVYIELTGKRYSKEQKEWFTNLVNEIPLTIYKHVNTIDSALVITNFFLEMQYYFLEKDIRVKIYKIKRKIKNVIDFDLYAL